MPKTIDLSKLPPFGRLKALERVGRNHHRQSLWLCRCKCGNEVVTTIQDLRSGSVSSCGCLRKDVATETLKSRVGVKAVRCRICKGKIEPSPGSHRTICSPECQREADRRRRKLAWAKMTQAEKDAHNERVKAAQKAKFAGERVCAQCGGTFIGPAKRKYCSEECLEDVIKSGKYRTKHKGNAATIDLLRAGRKLNERTDHATE